MSKMETDLVRVVAMALVARAFAKEGKDQVALGFLDAIEKYCETNPEIVDRVMPDVQEIIEALTNNSHDETLQ